MPTDHTEKAFETALTAHLRNHGYVAGDPAHFDAKLALDPHTLVRFLQTSQPKECSRLTAIYGGEVGGKVVATIARDLDQRGMLECLRHGVTDRGVKVRLAFFKPATRLNPVTQALYDNNILTVTRQVHFSEKQGHLSVDLLLSVNGLPIATAELKNPFTGQTVLDAQRQYREERDPREPLFQFKKRCLVHFAVDPDQVFMTTRLAGSGKSNTIAWVAHRLSSLHDAGDKLVFDSVIVITDRKVLDRQLQDTIYQFEHAQGVVQRIDENSAQLGDALAAGAKVIITTLQKFSFVLDRIKEFPRRRYALIVDEAHSSQTGESASNLRRVLTTGSLDDVAGEEAPQAEVDQIEEEILKTIQARGPQKNLSYFAFTATPKHKTLEVFGVPGADGKPVPFHLYSMRQAIEEGFILDVLKHYTTYATYYRLAKAVADDPEVDRNKATQAVARFVSLHPHNLAQKTEVMVEHFRGFTRKKIDGRAKAMLVTRSRLHAVRYKQAFDKYLKEKGSTDIGVLVAFSGTVKDGDEEYTEPGMNGIAVTRLPEEFAGDKYQILIVAEKYQTGFDQPLLHTMFVDKKLDGLQAVQTLSRLNRTCSGKEDTFVLDFANDAEEVRESFKPFFEQTQVEECVDPNLLYTLKNKLDGFQIYYAQEVIDFAKVFFKPRARHREQDQGLLHRHIDPAVSRFDRETQERKIEFRHQLGTFLRLYAFLAQIVDFHDPDLERLYAYGRLLITKLKIESACAPLDLEDDVKLAYYRLSVTHEGSVALAAGDATTVSGPTDVGTGKAAEPDTAKLSEIVSVLNERFGTDFTRADQLWFDQIIEDMTGDKELGDQARNNPLENFKLEFNPKVMSAVVNRIERNENIATVFLTNEDLREVAMHLMMQEVYGRLKEEPETASDQAKAG